MSKIDTLVTDVLEVVNQTGTNNLKRKIGNSTRNNRVVTVNQVITYLKSRKNPSYRELGTKLETVYETTVRQTAINLRTAFFSSRTDSVDLNEFIAAVNYRKLVDANFTRKVASII